jgi:hypothetical protein
VDHALPIANRRYNDWPWSLACGDGFILKSGLTRFLFVNPPNYFMGLS